MTVDENRPENPVPADTAAVKLLQQEISQLQHELRRVRDGLERNPSHALEQRAGQLTENIALCERDLQQLRGRSGTDSES